MPEKINSNYSASFQQFVDFADKAYAANKEDTFARFKGMTQEDYQGSFASFLRSSEMKAANDEVRTLFLKTNDEEVQKLQEQLKKAQEEKGKK